MGIFIKNPETEHKALAAEAPAVRKARSIEEMMAATREFRRQAGEDKVKLNVTKADFDALWDADELEAAAKPRDRR
jgi:antitoxin VapB